VAHIETTHKPFAFGNGVESQRKEPKMRIRIKSDFRWGRKRIAGSIEIRF
jgi:hypothetical protein